jgi:hypothetical protein
VKYGQFFKANTETSFEIVGYIMQRNAKAANMISSIGRGKVEVLWLNNAFLSTRLFSRKEAQRPTKFKLRR